MKRTTIAKAILYGLIYFFISGILPLVTQTLAQTLTSVALDFEPRTIQWLIIVGIFIGIFVCIEKLLEEQHPTGAGVFGILRYITGLIDVTLYYNLLLHVGIIFPSATYPTFGIDPTDPTKITLTLNYVSNNIFFALYLVTLGLLIYGGYCLNFFRYIYQMAAGYRLTEE